MNMSRDVEKITSNISSVSLKVTVLIIFVSQGQLAVVAILNWSDFKSESVVPPMIASFSFNKRNIELYFLTGSNRGRTVILKNLTGGGSPKGKKKES